MKQWISGSKNYIYHRYACYWPLVKYKDTEGEEIVDSCMGWLNDNGNNNAALFDRNDASTTCKFLKQFDLIPRFNMASEIAFSKEIACL